MTENKMLFDNKVLKDAMDIMSDSLKNVEKYKEGEMLAKKREAERTFFNCMKTAKLIAPVQVYPKPQLKDENQVMNMKNVKINFLLLKNPQGQSFFPVFTDFEEFNKWKNAEKPESLVVTVKEYEKLFEQPVHENTMIMMNPYSHGLIVKKELIKVLNAPAPKAVKLEDGREIKQEETKINMSQASFSEPSIYPTKMVNAMYDYCEGNEMIERADLRMMNSNNKSVYLVIVKHHGNTKEIFDELSKLALPLSKNVPVAFMNHDEKTPEKALENSIPFFERMS